MLTRNYYIYKAAEFVGKTSELYTQNSSTVKPPYITVTGEKVADTYNSSTYYYMSHEPSDYYLRNAEPKFVDVSQALVTATSSSYSSSASNYRKFDYGIFFGSGNTPPTIDDYKLEGTIATNCVYSRTKNFTFESDGSQAVYTQNITITNNNDTEITIGEIGYFFEEVHWTGYREVTSYPILIERTALESPITIPAGGAGQVTYTIRMNYPVG